MAVSVPEKYADSKISKAMLRNKYSVGVSALIMGVGWLPVVNLFGVPVLAEAAAASLFH